MLLDNYEKDSWIRYLVDNRVIVMTPMTNSYGYYYNERVIFDLLLGRQNICEGCG